MLYRLVRPVKRTGSSRQQFVQRIPADLRDRMVGMKLVVPIGEEMAFVTVTPKSESIRFSFKTGDPTTSWRRKRNGPRFGIAPISSRSTSCNRRKKIKSEAASAGQL